MGEHAALFERPTKQRWTGSRELVPVAADACPTCAGVLLVMSIAQPALFRHGGYGATQRQTERWCPTCGWHLLAEVVEVNPRG